MTSRGKTTSASTAGSFAPHERTAPEGQLIDTGEAVPTLTVARRAALEHVRQGVVKHFMADRLRPKAAYVIDGVRASQATFVWLRANGLITHNGGSLRGVPVTLTDLGRKAVGASTEELSDTPSQRLQREADVTDPSDSSFNSDLDATIPGLPLTYREVIHVGGIDPNDEDELDKLRDAYITIQTVPPRPVEDVRRELLDTLRSR